MRFAHLATLAAAFVLTGCFEKSPLTDTLMFPPGIDIQYQGKPAKLYGTSQCAQGQLSGKTCLVFPPNQPKAQGVIISGQHIYELELSVRQDPKGTPIISSTGRHDEYGNIDIRPVELSN